MNGDLINANSAQKFIWIFAHPYVTFAYALR